MRLSEELTEAAEALTEEDATVLSMLDEELVEAIESDSLTEEQLDEIVLEAMLVYGVPEEHQPEVLDEVRQQVRVRRSRSAATPPPKKKMGAAQQRLAQAKADRKKRAYKARGAFVSRAKTTSRPATGWEKAKHKAKEVVRKVGKAVKRGMMMVFGRWVKKK